MRACMYIQCTHKMKGEKTATMRLHTYIRVWISNKERQPSAQLRVLGLFVRWKKLCIEKNAQGSADSNTLVALWTCCGIVAGSRRARLVTTSDPHIQIVCISIWIYKAYLCTMCGRYGTNSVWKRFQLNFELIALQWTGWSHIFANLPREKKSVQYTYIDNYITIPSCDT